MTPTTYPCCFCATNIDKQIILLILINNYDKPYEEHIFQNFFSHIDCLENKMDIPAQRSAALFDIEAYKYQCCFCANYINETLTSLFTRIHFEKPKSEQKTQKFYCHASCITNQLSTTAKSYTGREIINIQNAPRKRIENPEHNCCFCTKPIEGKKYSLEAASNSERAPSEQYIQKFFFHVPCFTGVLEPSTANLYSILLSPDNE